MPPDSPLAARVAQHRRLLEAHGLTRAMRPPTGLDLSSNDYLGLARDARVVAAFVEGAAREGVGSTGSRLLRGDRDSFASLERRFADFKQTERSLFFSSGYLANLAVLTGLSEAGDVIFSDERNHASLIDACRLSRAQTVVVPHNDTAALRLALAQTPCQGIRLVVVESLYGMDGDRCPLSEYLEVAEAAAATLIVDEAHAVGVYGERGTGLLEAHGVDANRCLSINTGGKALGVGGALVAGPAWAIEHLVQRARPFVFSTAAPPALAFALQASLDLVGQEPERRRLVVEHSRELRRLLRATRLDVAADDSHIIPVVVGDNERAVALAAVLQTAGFDIRAIRPPSVPPGTARLRISVNATLTADAVRRFADALAMAWQALAAPAGA